MKRLSLATLGGISPLVQRPAYDPARVPVGILHLGIGRFHRAHEAFYTDALMSQDASAREWGICGVSLQSPRARDQLLHQDCLYTLGETGAAATRFRVIGAVREVLFAPESEAALLARLADPRVRIVSLTITEKGYAPDGPAIQALARGLRGRGDAPITLLPCDNLPGNGRVLRKALLAQAPDLEGWAARNASFPSTMVDRIVPELGDEAARALSSGLGYEDQAPVLTESFSQWVIEDDFQAGRPEWEKVGVQLCSDVAPYEKLKLRCLNGSHSALAYLGLLAGHETVDQAIAFAPLRRFIFTLMQDNAPGEAGYRASLLARFANPALKHRLAQIAMDGSQKLPPRLVAPARERLAAGRAPWLHALPIAAWIAFAARETAAGRALADPLAPEIQARLGERPDDPVGALLAMPAVFGDAGEALRDPVAAWAAELRDRGVEAALSRGSAGPSPRP